MNHKYTDESGMPIGENSPCGMFLSEIHKRPRIEPVEPVQFGSDDYNLRLRANDIFYRYPLEPRTEYDEGEIWRVGLIQNGMAYLIRYAGGTATVFADREWFQGRKLRGEFYPYGYTLIARYTGEVEPGTQLDRVHKWAEQYAGA